MGEGLGSRFAKVPLANLARRAYSKDKLSREICRWEKVCQSTFGKPTSLSNLIRPRHVFFHANDVICFAPMLREEGLNIFLTHGGDGRDSHSSPRLF